MVYNDCPQQNYKTAKEEIIIREEWLDYLRGIGIVLMIIGHVSIWGPIHRWIYGFHMPLFYIISGYLYNKKKWSDAGYKKFIGKRFRNYITPYFLWCSICFILNLPAFIIRYHQSGLLLAMSQNIGWIITSISVEGMTLPQNCNPLWFLTSIFICQLIFFWVIRCKPIWQVLLSCCFILINIIMNTLALPEMPWHIEVSLIGCIFMLVGYHIKDKGLINKIHKAYIILIFILSASLVIMLNGRVEIFHRIYGTNILAFIIGAVLMSFSFMWICNNLDKYYLKTIFNKLGTFSIIPMGINYAINSYARGGLSIFSKLSGFEIPWFEYPLAAINIAVCLLIIVIFERETAKHKWLNYLIGKT